MLTARAEAVVSGVRTPVCGSTSTASPVAEPSHRPAEDREEDVAHDDPETEEKYDGQDRVSNPPRSLLTTGQRDGSGGWSEPKTGDDDGHPEEG